LVWKFLDSFEMVTNNMNVVVYVHTVTVYQTLVLFGATLSDRSLGSIVNRLKIFYCIKNLYRKKKKLGSKKICGQLKKLWTT
jgi:hypothetical protein